MPVKPRRPWVAVVLSTVAPGLGHLYVGLPPLAGAIWLTLLLLACAGRFFLLGSFGLLLLIFAVLLFAQVSICVDAGIRARRLPPAQPRWFQRWYVLLTIALLLALASLAASELTKSVARYTSYRIPSRGMEPTLQIGDCLIADTWRYHSTEPRRGDIIVFQFPEDPRREFIKRCIALPGDTVEIRDGQVSVNGQLLTEPYVVFRDPSASRTHDAQPTLSRRDQLQPTVVPPGQYFLLGDNRDNSLDSRFFGPVPRDLIRGRALYLYWARLRSRIGHTIR